MTRFKTANESLILIIKNQEKQPLNGKYSVGNI
jgi:hypothetical protein